MIKKYLLAATLGSILMLSFTTRQTNVNVISPELPTEIEGSEAAETFLLDPKKCKVEWTGKGVGKQHSGTIDITTGNLQVDTKQITAGYVFVDMKTMKDSDIKDEGFNKQLTDHLKGKDFFNIQRFASSTFKITNATRLDVPEGQINYTIKGDLMMKGVTKSIEFPALVTFAKKKVTATATFDVDRTQWGVTYNSGNYMKDLGDKLIEDNINFKIYLEGNLK